MAETIIYNSNRSVDHLFLIKRFVPQFQKYNFTFSPMVAAENVKKKGKSPSLELVLGLSFPGYCRNNMPDSFEWTEPASSTFHLWTFKEILNP